MNLTKKTIKQILAVRFSAFGDVLLTYPVLKSICELNPDVEVVFLTQTQFVGFFNDIPRLKVIGADLKTEHKGVYGLYRLSQRIKKQFHIDCVCDLHQVVRTKILNVFLNKQTFKIDKGRKEKRLFVKHKKFENLPHTTQRYLDVFKKCGLLTPPSIHELGALNFKTKHLSAQVLSQLPSLSDSKIKLGIAPFAKHFTKTWPIQHLDDFLNLNEQSHKMNIFLFGGRGEETEKLKALEKKYPLVCNLAGKFNFDEEISLIQNMDLMLVMDSANMHLAGLSGTPLISIWGGTHPGVGFYPLSEAAEVLQVDRKELSCRPCSVFGQDHCPKTHFKCMLEITPELLMDRVTTTLKKANVI